VTALWSHPPSTHLSAQPPRLPDTSVLSPDLDRWLSIPSDTSDGADLTRAGSDPSQHCTRIVCFLMIKVGGYSKPEPTKKVTDDMFPYLNVVTNLLNYQGCITCLYQLSKRGGVRSKMSRGPSSFPSLIDCDQGVTSGCPRRLRSLFHRQRSAAGVGVAGGEDDEPGEDEDAGGDDDL
ncbi:hypothetical protein Tco_0669156, partial [Tanacetum coccineum]